MPILWLLAGVNGAGKTTFASSPEFQALVGTAVLLNPDALTEIIRARNPELPLDQANIQAANHVEIETLRCIGQGLSVVVETVLSTRKYEPAILRAKASGYDVGLIYIGLPDVNFSVARVRARREAQGHDVPEDRIRSRWSRSHDNLAYFARMVDVLFVFSNERQTGPKRAVASKQKGMIRLLDPLALPEVTRRLAPLCDG